MAASLRVCVIVALAMLAGCSRSHYRQRADADAYSLIHEKAGHTPWDVPYDYDVVPMPGSRLYDPTPLDDPLLPKPAPQLYAYDLPQLPERDPERFRQRLQGGRLGDRANPFPDVQVAMRDVPFSRLPDVTHQVAQLAMSNDVHRAAYNRQIETTDEMVGELEAELPAPGEEVERGTQEEGDGIQLTPVPASAWEDVPTSCKLRMFEFESIRKEFQRTFEQQPSGYSNESVKALALEDIVELALLNSREYQTQKETLYRAALRLSLQRFDYDLKFSTGGNRIATDYTHARDGGITVNRLRVPSGYRVDKMLATGGTVLMSFANNLLLTFNGANGFATDIGSDIVLDIEQTLLQIDVQFEPLTQAERDLVYAARDFARFRKTLYTTLTTQYYTLIRTYRQVEIDSQNYLTLARAFRQAEEEYRAGEEPRVQVDQVEQNMLRGRSRLIGTCNGLEQSIDNLKIRIGLPTETQINIDLTELEQLTRHDELAVRRELVRRVRKRLVSERNSSKPERVVLLSSSIDLIDRLLGAFGVLEQLGEERPNDTELRKLRALLGVQRARIDADSERKRLEAELAETRPDYPKLFGRTMDVAERLLILIEHEIEVAQSHGQSGDAIADMRRTAAELRQREEQLEVAIRELFNRFKTDTNGTGEGLGSVRFSSELRELVKEVTELRQACEDMIRVLDQVNGLQQTDQDLEAASVETLQMVDALLGQSDQLLASIGGGLAPIDVEFDDAMMTALVLRLDLMNERGALADDWRQIKLAADDLKSVLNLRATQTVRSPGSSPFDFTFDESLTRVNATLDLPLNRRAQRNAFRQDLINYQVALRRLMALEDAVKLDVRNDLRDLALDQEQYQVDIASAGLAFKLRGESTY